MDSQITNELELLKQGNFDHAKQFVEHLVNILTRQSAGVGPNSTIPQRPDDNFWGFTFNFLDKKVDMELGAMYAVTYRNNQLTLLFNPNEIRPDYTVETMLEGLRHEGYHLLFDHLNVHAKLENDLSNLAADCEINQHLEHPHKNWISREYIAEMCHMDEADVKAKAGSLYYYDLLANNMSPEDRERLRNQQQGNGNPQEGNGNQQNHQHPSGMCSSEYWKEAEVGKNGNYVPAEVTIRAVIGQAAQEAKGRGTLPSHIESAIDDLNRPPQVKWQNEVQKRMGRHITGTRLSPNRLYRRDPMALHKQGTLSDQVMPIVFAHDISGSVSREEANVFMNELVQIIKKLHIPVTHIQFDSEVAHVQELDGTNARKVDFTRYGCGGTTFQSVFDYVKEHKFPRETQIFIFTDGGGESTINCHGYKNYTWLVTDDNDLSVRDNRNKIIRIKSHE